MSIMPPHFVAALVWSHLPGSSSVRLFLVGSSLFFSASLAKRHERKTCLRYSGCAG